MNQQYTRRLEQIEAELARWLPENPCMADGDGRAWASAVFPGLEDMVEPPLFQALIAPGKDLLARGGKRWRPLLMTLVCEALGGGDTALPLAPLVELCHNASLIHDDIEDNSDERRGKPAVHVLHGIDTAINSGSFLYFLPLACIESWAAGIAQEKVESRKAQVYSLWAGYLRKLHLGQAMDIHWHRGGDVVPPIDAYYTMCKLKTGCLARFAAELGAAAAAVPNAQNLGEAAEKLGVGFQILDDVKNLTAGIPGKKRGDDIVEGKKSLPVLLFLRRRPEKKEWLVHCFNAARALGVTAPEVEMLIREFHHDGVLAEAEEQGKTLIAQARSALTVPANGLSLSAEGRALLAGLIDLIG